MTKSLPSIDLRINVHSMGLRYTAHQPVSTFKPGHRALPSVPRPDDPWDCYLFPDQGGTVGCVGRGHGPDINAALEAALLDYEAKRLRFGGLKVAMFRLEKAIDDLTFEFCVPF